MISILSNILKLLTFWLNPERIKRKKTVDSFEKIEDLKKNRNLILMLLSSPENEKDEKKIQKLVNRLNIINKRITDFVCRSKALRD